MGYCSVVFLRVTCPDTENTLPSVDNIPSARLSQRAVSGCYQYALPAAEMNTLIRFIAAN